jgi:hypothetical protein
VVTRHRIEGAEAVQIARHYDRYACIAPAAHQTGDPARLEPPQIRLLRVQVRHYKAHARNVSHEQPPLKVRLRRRLRSGAGSSAGSAKACYAGCVGRSGSIVRGLSSAARSSS